MLNKRNKRAFNLLNALADQMGVSLVFTTEVHFLATSYVGGKNPTIKIHVGAHDPKITDYDLQVAAHEFGHLIAAPPSRRRRRNFGIPEFPNFDRYYWDLDDAKACFVARYIEHAFDIPRSKELFQDRDIKAQKPKARKWFFEKGHKLVDKHLRQLCIPSPVHETMRF